MSTQWPQNTVLIRMEVMSILKIIVSFMLLLILMQPTHATIYSLGQHVNLPGDYGYFGTITTDGGIGIFSDTSVIVDWNIQLLTPGENDGVTNQNLIPANSRISFLGPGTLDISTTTIALSLSGSTRESSQLSFDADETDESLSFFSSRPPSPLLIPPSFRPGLVVIADLSEPQIFTGIFQDSQTIILATLIPEPCALSLCWTALVILCMTRTYLGR